MLRSTTESMHGCMAFRLLILAQPGPSGPGGKARRERVSKDVGDYWPTRGGDRSPVDATAAAAWPDLPGICLTLPKVGGINEARETSEAGQVLGIDRQAAMLCGQCRRTRRDMGSGMSCRRQYEIPESEEDHRDTLI